MAGHSSWIRDVQISGQRILSASNDKLVKVWDARTSECVSTLLGHMAPVNKVILGGPADPNIVTASSDGKLRIFDLRNTRIVFGRAYENDYEFRTRF
jgi:WD40 repeat protein